MTRTGGQGATYPRVLTQHVMCRGTPRALDGAGARSGMDLFRPGLEDGLTGRRDGRDQGPAGGGE